MTEQSCAACRAPLAPEDAFCGNCGLARPVTRFCGDCGAPVEATGRFCGDCGASVGPVARVATGAASARNARSSFGQIIVRSVAVVALLGLVIGGALAYRGGALSRFGLGSSSGSASVTPGTSRPSPTARLTPDAATIGGPASAGQAIATPSLAPTSLSTLEATSSGTTVAARTPTSPAIVVVRPPAVDTPSPTPRPSPTAAAASTPTTQVTPSIPPPSATSFAGGIALISDSFNRPDADRCGLGLADLALGGRGNHYYLPLFPSGGSGAHDPVGAKIVANALQNNGQDFGGVQLTGSFATCSGFPGENVGQDLNIRVDLLVPSDGAGHATQAGPFIRSRAAAPGDGIIGGTSAGYWIQLHSTGEVTVKRLNPPAFIASTAPRDGFDNGAFHSFEIAVQGSSLQIALDGQLVTVLQDGNHVTNVSIPATSGSNDGAAGIAFGDETNRGQIGGQRAKNLVVTSYHGLPGP